MKQLIAFGMALVLLFAAGTPAYTQEDATPSVERVDSPEVDITQPQAREERPEGVPVVPAFFRCREDCDPHIYESEQVSADSSSGCIAWIKIYSRCLHKQRGWPSCACVYTERGRSKRPSALSDEHGGKPGPVAVQAYLDDSSSVQPVY